MLSEVDEMTRLIARICGVAIALLIIIPIFNWVLGIDVQEFFSTVARDTFTTAVAG